MVEAGAGLEEAQLQARGSKAQRRTLNPTAHPAGVHLSGVAGSNASLGLSHIEEQTWQTNSIQWTSMPGRSDRV